MSTIEMEQAPQAEADTSQVSPELATELEQDPTAARVGYLQSVVDELAGSSTELSSQTREYVREGGSIQAALAEIEGLRSDKPSEAEAALNEARQLYAQALTRRGRGSRKRVANQYEDAIVGVIREAQTTTPTAEGTSPTLETLADNELSIVTDRVLIERRKLQDSVEKAKSEKLAPRILRNKVLRKSFVSGVVLAAISTKFGLIPDEAVNTALEHGLEAMTAVLFTQRAQRTVYGRVSAAHTDHHDRKVERAPLQRPELENLSERTIQKSHRYHPENQAPYDAQEARRFVRSEIYNRHLDTLEKVAAPSSDEETNEAFYTLVSSVVADELAKARKEVVHSHIRKTIFRGLAVATTAATGGVAIGVAESFVHGSEVSEALNA